MAKDKMDLNIWQGSKVRVFLDHGFVTNNWNPEEDDVVEEAGTIVGMFCSYDGEFIYLNHYEDDSSTCTLSIRKDKIVMIEIAAQGNNAINTSTNNTLN